MSYSLPIIQQVSFRQHGEQFFVCGVELKPGQNIDVWKVSQQIASTGYLVVVEQSGNVVAVYQGVLIDA